jgi:hypothetical protein
MAVLAAMFLSVTLPLLWGDNTATLFFDGSRDERDYHWPTIVEFANELPTPNLHDYQSATTPLFHLTMAVGKAAGAPFLLLRVLNLLISVACVSAVFAFLTRYTTLERAFLYALAFALSLYVVNGAVRLMTDNMALLFVVLAMIALAEPQPPPAGRVIAATIWMALAVLTRQTAIWLVPVAVWQAIRWREVPLGRRLRDAAILAVPILVLVPFVLLWHGLAPPSSANLHQVQSGTLRSSLRVLILSTAVLGFYGTFFLPSFVQAFRARGGRLWHVLLITAGCAVLLLAVQFNYTAVMSTALEGHRIRPSGMLIKACKYLPDLFSTSLLMWILVPIGATIVYVVACQGDRARFLVLCAGSWQLTTLMNVHLYQKYYEPFWLIFLGAAAAGLGRPRWMEWASLTGMLVFLAVLYSVFFYFPWMLSMGGAPR